MLKAFSSARRQRWIGWLALGWIAAFAPLCAQAEDAQTKDSTASEGAKLSADLVKTGLYVIEGGGANTLFRFSADGIILVDGKSHGGYRALMSQVRKLNKLSDLPVRVLIVTNHLDSHSGDNAEFLAAGVAIIAQQNARNRFPTYPPRADGKPLGPIVAFDREQNLAFGGVEVQIKHFARARSDGDAVVYFPGQKTLAVGDLYRAGEPQPDFSAGGSLRHWGEALAEALKLDFDTVVPSEGPPVPRAALEAYKVKIDEAVSRALTLVDQGAPKAQFMSLWRTEDLGWRFDFSGAGLDALYNDLTNKP